MGNLIHVLPESISDKIAAGEVVQGPSSIVKELLENSVDARSTEITLVVQDSGKTLIQVIDNGVGMSNSDIVMCLKKHSTSKIKDISDLYSITTMGFRGEAIASIIAVSKVEIISSTSGSEIGTKIVVENSNIISKENVVSKKGTIFTVKNIFYNMPARRAFLKSDNLELIYIMREFIRISLANPTITFKFISNDEIKYDLISSNLLKRICDIFRNKNKNNLIWFSEDVEVIKIYGYLVKPTEARKTDEMFIYVNKRYIVSNDIKTQILSAYKNLITTDKAFCIINIEIDPKDIDINISPSKTEIKFKNEQLVYSLIYNVIKRKLYYCQNKELNFDQNDYIDVNYTKPPFSNEKTDYECVDKNILFDETNGDSNDYKNNQFNNDNEISDNILVINNEYIVSTVKSGLILINANRALKRITYDKIFNSLDKNNISSQQLLFPNKLFIDSEGISILRANETFLKKLGFIIVYEAMSILVTGIPSFVNIKNINEVIELIIDTFKSKNNSDIYENIVKRIIDIKGNINLKNPNEAKSLLNKLFRSTENIYDPFGKRIIAILDSCNLDDIIDN